MEIIRYQMKYKIGKRGRNNNNLNILGKDFVKNNINKGKLIIENKKYYLKEYIKLNNYNFKKSEIKIDILLSQDICNISYMFNNIESLSEFSKKNSTENKEINYDFSEIENKDGGLEYNINKKDENKGTIYESLGDNIFYYEYSEIPKKEESLETESINFKMDNSQINIKSEEMIYKTESSSSLYDKLNFNNINDMSFMFFNCRELLSLPDISKWNTNNVKDMS